MRNKNFYSFSAWTALGAGLLVGCGDSEIKTYRVAKEDNQPPAIQTGAGASTRPAIPHVHSDVPEGWIEGRPEGMRVATYRISGGGDGVGTVSIIPLPGDRSIELESVNMWREELQLPRVTAEELKETSRSIQVGDAEGVLVDMTATSGGPTGTNRTIAAIAERGGIMWFVKMIGNSAAVGENKEKFTAFVKSLEFHEGSHEAPTQVASNERPVPSAERPVSTNAEKLPAESDAPKFDVPEHWTEKAAGPMVQRAFNISGENGQAEVTITKFPGDVGGMVANINRWRGQLGIAPLAEAEARQSAETLEIDGEKNSYLVDIKGTNVRGGGKPARMIAVGVPHQGQTWFFKLLGDESVVAKEKDSFVKFVVSAY